MQENQIKINFFKKLWYAISKTSKYEVLRKEGIRKAIKYFFSLVGIGAIILSIVATILQINVINDALGYLEEKLPEMKFKDNHLSLNSEKEIVLNEDKFLQYFGSTVVINPLLEEKEAINNYNNLTTEKNNVVIFLSDKYVTITNKFNPESESVEGVETHNYADVSSKYIKDTSAEYNKQSVIDSIKGKTPYTYYLAEFFVVYFISITLLYAIYIILITIGLWLVTKITKYKWDFKKSLINTIYASTLSLIVYVLYMIISYFAKFKISFMDVISIFLVFVYLFLLLWNEKKGNIEDNK